MFKVGDEIILDGINGLRETVRGKIIYKSKHYSLVCLHRTDIGWNLDFALADGVPKEILNNYKGKRGWWLNDKYGYNYRARIVRNLLEIE